MKNTFLSIFILAFANFIFLGCGVHHSFKEYNSSEFQLAYGNSQNNLSYESSGSKTQKELFDFSVFIEDIDEVFEIDFNSLQETQQRLTNCNNTKANIPLLVTNLSVTKYLVLQVLRL